jgi:hypothetical protein
MSEESVNPKVLIKSKKRIVKKKSAQDLAQDELDEFWSNLFETCIEIDVNQKLFYKKDMKDYFLDSYETHKRSLEEQYNLVPFTLTKSKFDNEEILDEPSKLITTGEDDLDITEEIDKLRKKIERAEKTIKKDKLRLFELTSRMDHAYNVLEII